MPESSTVSLGEVVDILTGNPFKSAEYNDGEANPKLLRGDNIAQGSLRWDNVKRWPKSKSEGLDRYELKAGDVVLAMDRPWIEAGLKYACLSEHDLPAFLVQRVARMRGTERLRTDFLRYLIGSRAFTTHVLGVQTGTAVPHISAGQIKSFEFDLPTLEDQESIAKYLGTLDDKIELNRRMNETLEEMARALFQDWFVDFGPTRRQIEGATDPAAIMGHAFPPEKASTLAPLFPAILGNDGLPEGWETCELNTVVEQQKQSVKPDQHLDEVFEHFSLPAFDKAKWPTPEIGSEIKSNKTVVPASALLVSKLNPRIERVWVPQRAGNHRQICSTEFLCFKPASGRGLATVEALFRSDEMRAKMAAMVTGTSNSHQRVPPKVLMQADVVLPEVCGGAFEAVALPFLSKRQANEQENQTLAEMRDLLLPKLMSGEIRLNEAEMV